MISKNAQVFTGRLIFAINTIVGFWLALASCIAIVAFLIWRGFQHTPQLHIDRILFVIMLASVTATIVALVPGKLLAMWPYAIALEPERGVWVYAPPTKLWIPLDEIVDIDAYSGTYGGGHVIQLNRSHGLVRQIYINSLFFPDKQLVREIRAAIDRRDGVVCNR